MDNVEIVKPEPDSQYRLCPCKCGSADVVYIKRKFPVADFWEVKCMNCGAGLSCTEPMPRHTVQVKWNRMVKND